MKPPNPHTRPAALLLAVTALAASACTSTNTTTTGLASPAPSAPASTPVSSPSTPAGPLKLGTAASFTVEAFTSSSTVYGYRQPLASRGPDAPGKVYAGLDAKVCITKAPEAGQVTWAPWILHFPDGTTAEPVSAWSADWFEVPLYPGNGEARAVPVGDCVRGWVIYLVPKGARASVAEYQPFDPDGNPVGGGPRWKLGS